MSNTNPFFKTVLDQWDSQWDSQWEMDFSFDSEMPLQWNFEENNFPFESELAAADDYPLLIEESIAEDYPLLTEESRANDYPLLAEESSVDDHQYYPMLANTREAVQQLCNPGEELRVNDRYKDVDEKYENLDKKYQELKKEFSAQCELDGQRYAKLKEYEEPLQKKKIISDNK